MLQSIYLTKKKMPVHTAFVEYVTDVSKHIQEKHRCEIQQGLYFMIKNAIFILFLIFFSMCIDSECAVVT